MSKTKAIIKKSLKKQDFIPEYSSRMNKYYQHHHYLEDYYTDSKNFIGGKLDHLHKNEIFKNLELKTNNLNANPYSVTTPNQYIQVRMQDDDSIRSGIREKINNWGNKKILADSLANTQYFAEASGDGTSDILFLKNPASRKNTHHNKVGMFPCSGGVQGTATYFKPGSQIPVQWDIQNPTEGGKCIIKMTESNSENPSSYTTLRPTDIKVDSTGYFDCGKGSGTESAEITIPSKSNCNHCTIQLSYKIKDQGEIYQCSDISTIQVEGTGDCQQK